MIIAKKIQHKRLPVFQQIQIDRKKYFFSSSFSVILIEKQTKKGDLN